LVHGEINRQGPCAIYSRRGFFGASTAAAGALAAGRWLVPRALGQQLDGARPSPPPEPGHPLDPLSAHEVERAVAVLREEQGLGDSWRFVTVTLAEPARDAVVEHRSGDPFERLASAMVFDTATGNACEATVDLALGKVSRFAPLAADLQPPIMLDEFVECEAAVKRSTEFRAALAKRGVRDVELVMVDPWSAGMYGGEPP
jgi:primary-amine oxidase